MAFNLPSTKKRVTGGIKYSIIKLVLDLPKNILLFIIKIYQRTLSLDHGPLKFIRPHGQCKFYPTCSAYTYQSIERYGALKGSWRGLKRFIRCHPWSKGGYDPINK